MTDRVYPNTASPPLRGAYYSVKDQPIPHPATYGAQGRQGRRRRGPCCCICLSLCGILWTLIIAIGIAALVIWLVVRPKIPKYDVNNFQVTGLTLTNSTTTGNLNPQVKFDVIARNPNSKVGIYYDNINLNVQTGDVQLGSGSIPGFYQGHKNTTTIPTTLKGSVASNRLTSINTQDLPLYVKADVKTRLKIGSLKTAKFKVKVRCNLNLKLNLNSGGQASILSKKCKVDT